jgi:hypothetical protein
MAFSARKSLQALYAAGPEAFTSLKNSLDTGDA